MEDAVPSGFEATCAIVHDIGPTLAGYGSKLLGMCQWDALGAVCAWWRAPRIRPCCGPVRTARRCSWLSEPGRGYAVAGCACHHSRRIRAVAEKSFEACLADAGAERRCPVPGSKEAVLAHYSTDVKDCGRVVSHTRGPLSAGDLRVDAYVVSIPLCLCHPCFFWNV